MTAVGAKAAYGSAPTKKCKKCDRKISRTNISKHVKVCKGIKLPETRSEIRKKSWEKNRAKRVGSQREKRAVKLFKELQDFRKQLREADAAQAVPQPQPKGMMGHALEVLSLHPRLFEFVFAKAEKHELLSKGWFRVLILWLHPDKRHHLPQEWQEGSNASAVEESFKPLPKYKEEMQDADIRKIYEERVRVEKYQVYLQTRFKQRLIKWEKKCQEAREATALQAKEGLAKFAEYADCTSFDDFKVIYHARFFEKDKAYEIKKKSEQDQAASDLRFLETFGADLDSDDE
ncbi:hypothetical protein DVH05_023475 [Phytophthora capsici]|nr:hypothetical protein DVH05_023473 [Phytophthora capsici]KAG1693390.1 hypothetical protein DVH05_023475 [Phytophthora capsici]